MQASLTVLSVNASLVLVSLRCIVPRGSSDWLGTFGSVSALFASFGTFGRIAGCL